MVDLIDVIRCFPMPTLMKHVVRIEVRDTIRGEMATKEQIEAAIWALEGEPGLDVMSVKVKDAVKLTKKELLDIDLLRG